MPGTLLFTCHRPISLSRTSFGGHLAARSRRPRLYLTVAAQRPPAADQEAGTKPSTGLGLQAAWYAAEQLGNIIGLSKQQQQQAAAAGTRQGALSREAALKEIKADYDKNYFVSGLGSMEAYDPQCLFADPFAGFNGVARFKKNVSNLGGLMRDVNLELIDWIEGEDSLKTKWRFSAVLDLPWKPLLAAAGSTTHVFDKSTGLVVKHIEDWDVEPGRVLRQLLRPAARLPGNRWEAGMRALHDGDVLGVWQAAAAAMLKATAVATPLLLAVHAVRGEGLPGGWGVLEVAVYLALVSAAATELAKVFSGISGGGEGF